MKKAIYAMLLVLWMIIVFLLSNQNGEKSDKTSGVVTTPITEIIMQIKNISKDEAKNITRIISKIVRKTAHFTSYMIGGILACLTFNSYKRINKNDMKYIVMFITLYATTDEIHQYFIPGRSSEIKDILLDTI